MAESQAGLCRLPSDPTISSSGLEFGLLPGPEHNAEEPRIARARCIIYDKRTIQDDGPLRRGDWTITVSGGN